MFKEFNTAEGNARGEDRAVVKKSDEQKKDVMEESGWEDELDIKID